MARQRCAGSVRPDRPFPGWQFTAKAILWAVRIELMLQSRHIDFAHTALFRRLQAYAPKLKKWVRPHPRPSNGSWRVDETYCPSDGVPDAPVSRIRSRGQIIGFPLLAKRDAKVAKR